MKALISCRSSKLIYILASLSLSGCVTGPDGQTRLDDRVIPAFVGTALGAKIGCEIAKSQDKACKSGAAAGAAAGGAAGYVVGQHIHDSRRSQSADYSALGNEINAILTATSELDKESSRLAERVADRKKEIAKLESQTLRSTRAKRNLHDKLREIDSDLAQTQALQTRLKNEAQALSTAKNGLSSADPARAQKLATLETQRQSLIATYQRLTGVEDELLAQRSAASQASS